MAKAIYSLKIFLFRKHFHLSKFQLNGLKEVNIFVIRFYMKAWFQSPISVEAPYQDFTFLQNMVEFHKTDRDLATEIIEKLSNHMWYLSEETVGLAFFDPNIGDDIKRNMVKRLSENSQILQKQKEATSHNSIVSVKTILTFSTKAFSDFVSKRTLNFFQRFKISTNFLSKDPSQWPNIKEYRDASQKLRLIKVVNDTAERGVQLMSEYNERKLTNDEVELQYILVVVQEYRKKYHSYIKKDLVSQKPTKK